MLLNRPTSSILLVTVIGSLLLSGCEDRRKIANDNMDTIRNSPSQPVEPPPQPELVEDYVYHVENTRSPFLPPSLLVRQKEAANTESVKPDVNRVREPLEAFELPQLTYRGMLISPDGQQHGLIQRPDGLIDSVQVGDYMGTNDGRIVEITSTQINLIEIVPDSRAGFIEKPVSVISP